MLVHLGKIDPKAGLVTLLSLLVHKATWEQNQEKGTGDLSSKGELAQPWLLLHLPWIYSESARHTARTGGSVKEAHFYDLHPHCCYRTRSRQLHQ